MPVLWKAPKFSSFSWIINRNETTNWAEDIGPKTAHYTPAASAGLSSHCFANASLWLTTAVLVYEIAVEAYCPWRVRRQFRQRQEFPVPSALERVSRHDHR